MDAILRVVVDIFEVVFPNRVRGYYVLDSYGDGSAVEVSDIERRRGCSATCCCETTR